MDRKFTAMDILIDTHILVLREYDRSIQKHLKKIIRLFNELNYRLVIHPSSIEEIKKDNNITNKTVLLSKIETYPVILAPEDPSDDDAFMDSIGKPKNWRDKYDNHLLHCLYKKKVSYFLTEDPDLLAKSEKLNITGRVMNLRSALTFFKDTTNQKKIMESGVPVYCFYPDGDVWRVGEKGKTRSFQDLKGFQYIHLLLSHPRTSLRAQDICSSKMDSDGKYERAVNFQEENKHQTEDSKSSSKKKNQLLTPKMRKLAERELAIMNKKLDDPVYLLSDEGKELEIKADRLEKYLRERPINDNDPNQNKARISVYKALNMALNKIHEFFDSAISRHLNGTIKTGYQCVYNPPDFDKPSWILHPNQLDPPLVKNNPIPPP